MDNKRKLITKHKKKNVRMFPIYKAISWDFLFYYSIIFLFLTQVKGFSASQVLFSDSIYTISSMFWQIPITRIIDKIGKKNCLIIGNILYTLSVLAMIFMNNYYELLMIQFIYALGYSIKGLCESNILYDSLPNSKKRGHIFSKIDGKSSSYFYIFDALACIIAGFTFVINGYIPMILCFICCLISTSMSFKFRHTNIVEEKVEPVKLKTYIGQLRDSFKYFVKSKRIRTLIIFNAIFMGIMFGIGNLRSSILLDLKIPNQYFGVIFAVLQLIAAFTSRKTEGIQNVFKNKTLAYLSVPVVFSCLLIGIIGNTGNNTTTFILIFIMFAIQYSIKGPFMALMNRYLNNFTNRNIRPKISAAKSLSSNLFTAFISMLCALLLQFSSTANIFIIIGCITTIIVVLLLDYMRDKVGLKPEQYKNEDIKYSLNRPEIKES